MTAPPHDPIQPRRPRMRYDSNTAHTAVTTGVGIELSDDDDLSVWPAALGADKKAGARAAQAFSNQRVYEAFSDLHALAQRLEKPFDSPAVLVLGHQTDGKSALVEALIGLQFNDVGGGTKTRRPLALHMRYNPACPTPVCVLVHDDLTEQEMGLPELQAYIQKENARLEAGEQFSEREIIVRVEYRNAPNLTIIDTPGLISAPPGKAHMGLQAAARTIEAMVAAKAASPELVLLCLEDSSDWTHATTRKLAMEVDPSLARTVLVSTKFDTKLATFSRPSDADAFLHPTCLGASPPLGSAPFFTSVPAGRVGPGPQCSYSSNEAFRQAVADREAADVAGLEALMQRRLGGEERRHVGIGSLRSFLESLLLQRYLARLPSILPLLDREAATAAARLAEEQTRLAALNHTDLKERGRQLTDEFLVALGHVLRGNAGAPPDRFGETLADEHAHAGAFILPSGAELPVPDSLENSSMRLYGGAQFHRAMAEFRVAVGQMTCPDLSREEVANACGLEDSHDGANYMRAACVIAVAKARAVFEPFIHQLAARLSHVLRRMLPAAMHMLESGAVGPAARLTPPRPTIPGAPVDVCHEALSKALTASFNEFVDEMAGSCKARCLEDLQSTTRYVTWSLHTKSARSLRAMLGRVKLPGLTAAVEQLAAKQVAAGAGKDKGGATASPADVAAHQGVVAGALADLLENILFSRSLSPTSEELVSALVAQMFEGVRDFVVQAAELKFNCFFLMPVVDVFPARLRGSMEALYDGDLDEVFHTKRTRTRLEARVHSLGTELQQVERLQRKFRGTQALLAARQDGLGDSIIASHATLALGGQDDAFSASVSIALPSDPAHASTPPPPALAPAASPVPASTPRAASPAWAQPAAGGSHPPSRTVTPGPAAHPSSPSGPGGDMLTGQAVQVVAPSLGQPSPQPASAKASPGVPGMGLGGGRLVKVGSGHINRSVLPDADPVRDASIKGFVPLRQAANAARVGTAQ